MIDKTYRDYWVILKKYLRDEITDSEKNLNKTEKTRLDKLIELIPTIEHNEYILEIMNNIESEGLTSFND